jgi:two-component system phosphate regulon response regulator PhoB
MEASSPATIEGEAARVLVVDDEPDIQRLVVHHLRRDGFDAIAVGTGREALELASSWHPVVIVLDLMLPDIPGPEVCRSMRRDTALADVGVLMLTARGDEYDRVLGFEAGTDDYVVKPFSPRELVHRVRALARRSRARSAPPPASGSPELLRWRDMVLDRTRHRVTCDGDETPLRPLEFRLLQLFLEHPEQVLTRARLLADAWGITAQVNTRTVDTHVRRLREALGEYGDAIETVYGVGYRLKRDDGLR